MSTCAPCFSHNGIAARRYRLGARQFLRSSCPVRRVIHHRQKAKALSHLNEPILEGDLVAYRTDAVTSWVAAAVVEPPQDGVYLVRPVVKRESSPSEALVELFVDWNTEQEAQQLSEDIFEIRLLDADPQQRVVQDRIENPHGEHSEICWRVSRAELASVSSIPTVE